MPHLFDTDDQYLLDLQKSAQKEGLAFVEELAFENGAVYKGYLKDEMRHGPGVKSGQTMLSTKVNGAKIKQMAVENSGMLMVTSMRENGRMTRPMVSASTSTSMVLSTKGTGRTISKTAKAWRAGKMAPATKVATKRV